MRCPRCDVPMESAGYGDEVCPECGHVEYSETAEEFAARLRLPPPETGPNSETGN